MNQDPVIIEPSDKATACVIWLHGLGANGHDFEPIVPMFKAQLRAHTRFVFPHAPSRPITVNGGMVMPGWYDIKGMDLTQKQDPEGVHASYQLLKGYIEAQVAQGIPQARIVIAGFSQGGAITLHALLRLPHKMAGFIALSTYLPLADRAEAEKVAVNLNTPIFMGHGDYDPVVPVRDGRNSRLLLEQFGYAVEWHEYGLDHGVNYDEIQDINDWLCERIGAADATAHLN